MLKDRASGILLHPTSLPGRYGIGTLGKAAFDFIDFLVKSHQKYWQILPLGPTGYADSPYQCFSAHAGNPNLIDLEILVKFHLLDQEDLQQLPEFDESRVDFELVQNAVAPLLEKAFVSFQDKANEMDKLRYRNFLKDQSKWLNDYALFRAIKEHFDQKPWYQWADDIRKKEEQAVEHYQSMLIQRVKFHKFLQYLFFTQWMEIKSYAQRKKIRIIGDIPLYVALDSADAWANPGIFEFDDDRKPIRVGGVPPDYFSETGQLWGNPLFRWDVLKKTNYHWWVERIKTNLFLYDIIRIDHFRGFAGYWAVDYGEKTAIKGEWVPGPGKDFFHVIQAVFGELPIIAEDLGVMTAEVEELRDEFHLPGMKILEFAFDSSEANEYLPHNYISNCIVYTGTHDNDTITGWYKTAKKEDRQYVLDYLNTTEENIHWSFLRLAWASVANTAMVPMQDLLGLESDARMNLPGTTQGNWQWRARHHDFSDRLAEDLGKMTVLYGRTKKIKTKSQS